MIHIYRFMLFPDAREPAIQPRSGTEVILSYTPVSILPNDSLEEIARVLITQAIVGWLTGEGDQLDYYISPNVLKNNLLIENLHELANWVNNFNDVSLHNLNDQQWTCVWIVFI